MEGFPTDLEPLRKTLSRALELKGFREEQGIVLAAQVEAIHTEHDNLDGGTDYFDLILRLPLEMFVHYENRLPEIEKHILETVRLLWRGQSSESITAVTVAPSSIPTSGAGAAASLPAAAVPSFWERDKFRLFITHCSSVKGDVSLLQEGLSHLGVSAFVAHLDIEPTKAWQVEIERALRSMEALVAVLTADFPKSRWCDQEVGYALGQSRLILPVRYGLDPYGFIGKDQALTPAGPLGGIALPIVKVLLARAETAASMANALPIAFRNAWNFDNAKTLMSLLELLPSLSKEGATLIRAAVKDNSQVEGAWGVPDRANRLLRRFRLKGVGVA